MSDKKQKPFWVVWNPKGNNSKYRHATKEIAVKEAKRITSVTGDTVYVLQAIGKSEPEVVVKKGGYSVIDDIPF